MEFQDQNVVVIGAGLLQIPVIRAAKSGGAFVVALDMNPNAPGIAEADDFIQASTLDADQATEAVVRYHNDKKPFHAVLTVGTDASYTVARCAERLGLPGISPQAALAATDKALMRNVLRREKVPVPDFEVIDTYPKAVDALERLGSDCVIKPLRSMGARGVRRIFNLDDLKEGFEQAVRFSKDGQVILEQYIDAPELSIDALVYHGEVFITGVADRIIEYDPFFVETGHIMPSQLPSDWTSFAVDTFKKGVAALGISHGAAKGDIKISGNACYIGEIAARLSGGFMSAYTYPLSSGVDLMTNMVRIALGREPKHLEPKKNWVSIERAVIAPPGMIQSIEGVDAARKVPGVEQVFFDAKAGDRVKPPVNNLDKCGHVIVACSSYEEAVLSSHQAVRAIQVKTREEEDQLLPDMPLNDRARARFNGRCFVCPECDGVKCRGMLPGVGGVATGQAFIQAVARFKRYQLQPRYLHAVRQPDTRCSFLGTGMDYPILPGPITGSITNLGGAIGELNLARAIVKGANQAGVLGFVGDGATPTKYKIGIKTVLENFGLAVPIFKPRVDNSSIIERIQAARKAGAVGVGIDIDAASFVTMDLKGQATSPKTLADLKELVAAAEGLPFILKGVLSPYDAEIALKAGIKILIVSNHGGRTNDSLPAPIDCLTEIRGAVGKNASLILDGGVRSGSDVLKALALGADYAMVGRPVMIAAVGGGIQGVRQCIQKLGHELKKAMTITGLSDLAAIQKSPDIIRILD